MAARLVVRGGPNGADIALLETVRDVGFIAAGTTGSLLVRVTAYSRQWPGCTKPAVLLSVWFLVSGAFRIRSEGLLHSFDCSPM